MNAPRCDGWGEVVRRIFLGLVMVVGLQSTAAIALDAVPSHARVFRTNAGVRVGVEVHGERLKTGDRTTITATVTNPTDRPVKGITLLLGLVDLKPGQPSPLGLETWTSDPESVALPRLLPGQSALASWNVVLIQPGPLGVYASALVGRAGPIESTAVTVAAVRDARVLNPGNVLPVALAVPLFVVSASASIGLLRQRRGQ